MRVGIVDLGTNSVRFDIHQITQRSTKRLHREKWMVRLGQEVFLHGKLSEEAKKRTLAAFSSFRETAQELRVNRMLAFGTAALREAQDGSLFLEEIERRTGIHLQVISGKEEARLIATGILQNEKLPKGRFGLVDIGGGSTEISLCRGDEIQFSNSFSLGTARLQQVFLKTVPPSEPLSQLKRYIKSVLLSRTVAEDWPKVPVLLGSSGTIRAISKLLKSSSIKRDSLKKLVKTLSTKTTSQLLDMPGMEPKRVDMILSGAILLLEIMEHFKSRELIPTEFSLRDGILEEQIERIRQELTTNLGFHLEEIRTKCERLYGKFSHCDHVAKTASILFKKLARLHRLPEGYHDYLMAAAWMHDLGEVISPTQHEKHGYYFIKHADISGMDDWETELIAQLCLHHRSGSASDRIRKSKLLSQEEAKRGNFLLSLLRVADALDRGHQALAILERVTIKPKQVILKLKKNSGIEIESLRIEQKKPLFEEMFGRALKLNA